ncbi:hypothetical protein NDU88_005817 [Pleurodeles waltl]|uniref:Uncharacterized protein n=1 Tax=Pleurodeles waltl TaxID=8319 RepID=A0AAV7TWM4_PLEWA|nr:hypothetical protein NDU88_005817 [Pleurodeles waltl]
MLDDDDRELWTPSLRASGERWRPVFSLERLDGQAKVCQDTSGATMDATEKPATGLDTTSQTLRQMEVTLHNHTSQLERVLQAILDTKTTLETKVDAVTLDVNLLRSDHQALAERVTDTERDVVALTPSVKDLQE